MAGFKFERFRGEYPKIGDRVIDGRIATIARDCRLDSGEVQPLYQPVDEFTWTLAAQAAEYSDFTWHDDELEEFFSTGTIARFATAPGDREFTYSVTRATTDQSETHEGVALPESTAKSQLALGVSEYAPGTWVWPSDAADYAAEIVVPATSINALLNTGYTEANKTLYQDGNETVFDTLVPYNSAVAVLDDSTIVISDGTDLTRMTHDGSDWSVDGTPVDWQTLVTYDSAGYSGQFDLFAISSTRIGLVYGAKNGMSLIGARLAVLDWSAGWTKVDEIALSPELGGTVPTAYWRATALTATTFVVAYRASGVVPAGEMLEVTISGSTLAKGASFGPTPDTLHPSHIARLDDTSYVCRVSGDQFQAFELSGGVWAALGNPFDITTLSESYSTAVMDLLFAETGVDDEVFIAGYKWNTVRRLTFDGTDFSVAETENESFVDSAVDGEVPGSTAPNMLPRELEWGGTNTVMAMGYDASVSDAGLRRMEYDFFVHTDNDVIEPALHFIGHQLNTDGTERSDIDVSLALHLEGDVAPTAVVTVETVVVEVSSGTTLSTTTETATATLAGVDLSTGTDYQSEFSGRILFEWDATEAGYAIKAEIDGAAATTGTAYILDGGVTKYFALSELPERFDTYGRATTQPVGEDVGNIVGFGVRYNGFATDWTDTYSPSSASFTGMLDSERYVGLGTVLSTPGGFFELRSARLDDSSEASTAWVFTDTPSYYLGDPLRNDIYGRFYWVEESKGLRVESAVGVISDYDAGDYTIRDGFAVGVPPAEDALQFESITLNAATDLQMDITHAGLLTIPGFTAKGMAPDGTWGRVHNRVFPNERHAICAQTADITVPDTYYAIFITEREDYEAPIKNEDRLRLFNPSQAWVGPGAPFDARAVYFPYSYLKFNSKTLGLDALVMAQKWVFHWVPDGSAGFKLNDPGLDFASFGGVGTFSLRVSAFALANDVSAEPGVNAAGIDGENELTLTDSSGGNQWLHPIRFTQFVEQFPPNWHLNQIFAAASGNEWAARPGTFNPVLITDPTRILSSELFYTETPRRHTYDFHPSGDNVTQMTFCWDGAVQPYSGFTEEFLNRLWIYEIDSATYTALSGAGMPILSAPTDFTTKVEEPGVAFGLYRWRWYDGNSDKTTPLYTRALPSTGIGRYRVEESRNSLSKLYNAEYNAGDVTLGDIYTTGPELIDSTQGYALVDWDAALYPGGWASGGAFLSRDPLDADIGAPGAGRLTMELAWVLVNQYEEEGAPLLTTHQYYEDYPRTPVSLRFYQDGEVLQDNQIEFIRLYRQDEDGTYYLHRQIDVRDRYTSEYFAVDVDPGGVLDRTFPMVSIDHDEPPAGVTAGVMHPNGFIILGAGNLVVPSKLGYNHAFPVETRLEIPERVVGFGQYGDTIVVLTDERPYILTGDTPATLNIAPVDLQQGCLSQRSIVEIGGDVVFASPDGLYSVGRSGVRDLTGAIIGDREWQVYAPESMHAYNWRGQYVGFYRSGAEYIGMSVDPSDIERGVIHYTDGFEAGYRRPTDNRLFLMDGTNIVEWDASDTPYTWTWKTKVLQGVFPKNPGRLRINAGTYPNTLNLWSDGTQIVTDWSIVDDEPYALPSGYLEYEFTLQVEGTGLLYNIDVGETIGDLKRL